MAGRLRVHTEYNNNALTLPDYFTGRFEDKSRILRIISALVILLFFTIYCASGIVAGARLFESTFGMSYETALWAGAAATINFAPVGFPRRDHRCLSPSGNRSGFDAAGTSPPAAASC